MICSAGRETDIKPSKARMAKVGIFFICRWFAGTSLHMWSKDFYVCRLHSVFFETLASLFLLVYYEPLKCFLPQKTIGVKPRYITYRGDSTALLSLIWVRPEKKKLRYLYELQYGFQATNTSYFILLHTQRRETWCPGALLASAPLASAASLAANSVQVRLARISSSPSSEESEFDEMSRDAFLSTLDEEEERKSLEDGRRKVAFASPRAKRFVPSVLGQVTLTHSWGESVVVEGRGRKRKDIRATKVFIPKDQV